MRDDLAMRMVVALESIAAGVAQLAPPREAIDWRHTVAASWMVEPHGGALRPHRQTDPIRLDDLVAVERQKTLALANTAQFVAGLPANNVLLWGARGTGKSSLVHALLNEFAGQGLRLIEVQREALAGLHTIIAAVADLPYRFIVFCDDLSFEADDASYKALKSALDGSVLAMAANVVVYATSNRRHLLPESLADNRTVHVAEGEIHHGEAVDEKISLSDRFGLWISFYNFVQDSYIEAVSHWVEALARRHGILCDFDDEARAEALRWALARGNRNGRVAQQFARHWIGRRFGVSGSP